MPPRSTGIHAVGEALQSETNRKISDRYQPAKSISTSITNPPPLVPQDLPRQSVTSEGGADADNGMGLVLFTNDPSSQEVQSPIHHFEKEGGTSEIIRKRFKTANGNVIPLPLSTELHLPADQFANATINPVILTSAISALIPDPFQPNAATNCIQRFWASVPNIDDNGIRSLPNDLQRGSKQDLPDTALSNDKVELLAQKPSSEPPVSGAGLTITTQRR